MSSLYEEWPRPREGRRRFTCPNVAVCGESWHERGELLLTRAPTAALVVTRSLARRRIRSSENRAWSRGVRGDWQSSRPGVALTPCRLACASCSPASRCDSSCSTAGFPRRELKGHPLETRRRRLLPAGRAAAVRSLACNRYVRGSTSFPRSTVSSSRPDFDSRATPPLARRLTLQPAELRGERSSTIDNPRRCCSPPTSSPPTFVVDQNRVSAVGWDTSRRARGTTAMGRALVVIRTRRNHSGLRDVRRSRRSRPYAIAAGSPRRPSAPPTGVPDVLRYDTPAGRESGDRVGRSEQVLTREPCREPFT